MRKLVLIILIFMLIGISPVISSSGELEDAQEVARQNPNDALAHYKLGNAYGKSGQYLEAITSFKEAIRIKPDYAVAHNNLGYAYEKISHKDKAIASYKEALRNDPNNTSAQNNLNKLEQKIAAKALASALLQEDILMNFDELKMEETLLETTQKKVSVEKQQKQEPKKTVTEKTQAPEVDLLKELQRLAKLDVKPVPEVEAEKVQVPLDRPDSSSFKSKLRSLPKTSYGNAKSVDANKLSRLKETFAELEKLKVAKTTQNGVSQQGGSKRQSGSFCKSWKFAPINCTEADRSSREIWFEFKGKWSELIYRQKSNWGKISDACRQIIEVDHGNHRGTGKFMRNGNFIFRHSLVYRAKEKKIELLGIESNPKDSFVAISDIKNFKFTKDSIDIEFKRNVQSVVIKYADEEKEVQTCQINYAKLLKEKLAKRRTYELAHAEAVKSQRNFGNVAPSLLQQRKLETVPPSISFSSIDPSKIFRTDSYQTFIRGKVTDNEGVLTLMVNGRKAAMKADGTFAAKLKLRVGKNRITVLAEDINGNVAEKILTIIREDFIPEETLADVDLPPKTKTKNPNGIAIVIGVENYQYVSEATYAYNDAEVFREYLAETMGFSKAKVKIVTNRQATLAEFNKLLSPNGWLARNINPGKSEIVIYFSGHGIPDRKTKQTGLLPFDVDPNYSIGFRLSDLYASLGNLNAKSILVFLDACFTGENRERRMLLADARGIVVIPKEKNIPNNLTVLSAASGGQFSGALKQKEHGLFTYYVLKGLSGDADNNRDKQLTIGELGNYVQVKVKEQAAIEGREQVPELQGNTEKVLVQW